MQRWVSLVLILLLGIPAFGCMFESRGFSYPEAGLRFRPRENKIKTEADYSSVELVADSRYEVLIPPTLSTIENTSKRVIASGIAGQWTVNSRPLFDEVAVTCYGESTWCNYRLVEERTVDVPWPGLHPPQGVLRVFYLTPKRSAGSFRFGCGGGRCGPVDLDGSAQYTFAVTVYHNGNTIEFCWREDSDREPTERKINQLFRWTEGISFHRPRGGEDTDEDTLVQVVEGGVDPDTM